MTYTYFIMKYKGGEYMTLRQFREKKGMSQAELGNRVGLKQTTISQYENGSRTPTLAMAKKLSDVLEISLDDFFCSILFQNEM